MCYLGVFETIIWLQFLSALYLYFKLQQMFWLQQSTQMVGWEFARKHSENKSVGGEKWKDKYHIYLLTLIYLKHIEISS